MRKRDWVFAIVGGVLWLVFGVLVCTNVSFGWEQKTLLGIRIRASQATITQYNKHWARFPESVYPLRKAPAFDLSQSIGYTWDEIEWDVVDRLYEEVGSKYKHHANPAKLIVTIALIAYQCWGDGHGTSHGDGYDFMSERYGCIDGWYPSANHIIIFFGDDPGQAEGAFSATALEHELLHYFKFWSGDPTWRYE